MGLFNQHQRQSSSASGSMDPRSSVHAPSRSSTSSSHSVHSSHSTATLKPDGSRPSSSSAGLAYAVGLHADQAHQQQHRLNEYPDVDMGEGASSANYYTHHAPRHPPMPPARTSSLSHDEGARRSLAASASLPTVSLTHATPLKQWGVKEEQYNRPGQPLPTPPPASRGGRLGHGSLDVTTDELSPADSKINTSLLGHKARLRKVEDDDSDEEYQLAKRAQQEQAKKDRMREQGRKRQAKKRERDKKAKEEAKAGLTVNPTSESSQHSSYTSRNASSASLAPLSTPTFAATTPPSRASTSTSTFYSSLPTSASMTSLTAAESPYTIPSQQISGTSSPNTVFLPMTSTVGSTTAFDQQAWSTGKTYASRSAVDVRLAPLASASASVRKPRQAGNRGSSGSLSMTMDQQHTIPVTPTLVISPSAQNHPAKRRRSEPEPELFKKSAEVGLGVMGITEHEHEAIEYLDSPAKPSNHSGDHLYARDRPGIRRTASDSAAMTLDFSQPPSHSNYLAENRSPTPPPLASLNTGHKAVSDLNVTSLLSREGEWFAETVITAMTCSEHSAVQTTLSQLGLALDDLRFMAPDFAACYEKLKQFKLEKKMKEVSLNDTVRQMPSTSAYTSVANTPLRESAPLSTTSTSSSSPTTSRVELSHSLPMSSSVASLMPVAEASQTTLRPAVNAQSTTTSSNAPSRARSLSSASLRARGLKLGSKTARSPTLVRQHPDPLVSPMNTTTFQFPNTPSFLPMPESDGASPMLSSVQTPVTAQSAYFNHEDIDAAMNMNAGQTGYGGMGGHQRSATDPMGSKMYSTRQQHSIPAYHPSGSSTDVSETYNRASASSSGLSSPVDMSFHARHHSVGSSFGQLPNMPAPPPHHYPVVPSSSGNPMQPSDPGPTFDARATPSTSHRARHQYTYSHPTSAGPPFTPTSQGHRPSQTDVNVWQPNITPIPEQGTPTRPSSHQATPMMMDDHQQQHHHHHSLTTGIRQGGLDQQMLSPQPLTAPAPLPLEGSWPNLTGVQSGQMDMQGSDPFMVPYQHLPRSG